MLSIIFLFFIVATRSGLAQEYVGCKSTSGQDGECISTKQCTEKGGVSDPANLCPGAANIQCCTYGTCKSDGLAGECIPVPACKNAGGSSQPNLCKGGENIQCCTYGYCTSTRNIPGECVTKRSCRKSGGSSDPAFLCPGDQDIQCCTYRSCKNSKGESGQCEPIKSCKGNAYPGFCPGDEEIQCCVDGCGQPTTTTTPTPKPTGIRSFDISSEMTTDFWTCMIKKFKKPVIRGYFQSCSTGGAIDPSFIKSYKQARVAGFTNIDSYFFPCTGKQPDDYVCKSPKAQIRQFENYITEHNIQVRRLWLDVEPTSGECNAFNLGSKRNKALAEEFTAIMRNSTFKWGIYSNCGQWTSMFATEKTDIGSDLPFWSVQFDNIPGVNTVDSFCGGWTKAFAKQYTLDTTKCGGGVDLDSFRE